MAARTTFSPVHPRGWLSRWWPVLVPAAASVACAMVLTVRYGQAAMLRSSLKALSENAAVAGSNAPAAQSGTDRTSAVANGSSAQQQEIQQLQQSVRKLSAEISRLEELDAQNKRLRAQLAASASALSPEDAKAVDEAEATAQMIECVNHLKQLGLAIKVWELDNGHAAPTDLLSMTNELGSLIILHCPADTAHQAQGDPRKYTSANCSYEYLGAGAPDTEPNLILAECPIHGTLLLNDGSVQQGVAKKHPEDLIRRNGRLYLKR